MRRVVITGIGIVSSIGVNRAQVAQSLREVRSGIEAAPEYRELGFRSQVHGPLRISPEEHIDRKVLRFMGDAAAYSHIAMAEAIADAGLSEAEVSSERTGLVAGSGGASTANTVIAADTLREKGARRIGPYMVPRTMSSTVAACLGTAFHVRGVSYSISSACATSAHCIGNGTELIQAGKQDIVFAGGGEELHWTETVLFDAMGALSSRYNDTPASASRPYDAQRDGFVISGGGGIVVLEDYERARARGARIYAEVVGYGATADGFDMVAPSGEGAARCMRQALAGLDPREVDYLNTHGTSTPVGDVKELEAVRAVFGDHVPRFSSTKALTGHSLGAAGVHEAIYSLLMMQCGFICPSAHIETPDEAVAGLPLVREPTAATLNLVMSNSFGFGGTNATLTLRRVD